MAEVTDSLREDRQISRKQPEEKVAMKERACKV